MKEHVRRKYEVDILRTQGEIAHSLELHRWYFVKGWFQEAAKHLKNVRRREAHLIEIEGKLRNEQ